MKDETPGGIRAPKTEDEHIAIEQSTQQQGGDEMLWLSFAVALLRHPRLLITTPIVVMLLFMASARLTPRSYVAESQFLPQVSNSVSDVFGFSVPSQGEGPDFYQTLIESRQFLKEIALSTYSFKQVGSEDSTIGNLIDLYDISGSTEQEQLLAAVRRLRSIISVEIDRQTSVMTIETTTPWPELSTLLNRRVLEHTNTFNLERRQSRARTEREFVEGRVHDRREELTAVEDELEQFLDRNRSLESSPQLQFQRGRIERRVSLAAGVYTTLSQAYEQARIDEIRNTPVVTVIDPPEGSVRVQGVVGRRGAMGLVLGLGMGVALALAMEFYVRLRRQHVAELQEAEDLLRSMPATLVPRFRSRQQA